MGKNRRRIVTALAVTGFGLFAADVQAAPVLRVQVSQKGDFALLGNTFGHECAAGTPAPVIGTVGACGTNTTDSSPDVFWRADAPAVGQAEADTTITAAQARSSAQLTLPGGASVTHAFLYWAAARGVAGTDTSVTLDRQGGFSEPIGAIKCYQGTGTRYQCVADITEIVQTQGDGAYRVSGVDIVSLLNTDNSTNFGAWWMGVFYTDNTAPLRNLALFEGFDEVTGVTPPVMLSGFLVPNAGFGARLAVISFEGDNTIPGDQLQFNGPPALSDALNPANNFFNGSRSNLGVAVSNVGDLPQLTGTPQSMSGLDLDIIDVTSKVAGGQTSATIQVTTSGDNYYLGGYITAISDVRPDFTTTTDKTVTDLNGGAALAGDVLEYVISTTNVGTDTAIDVVLTDVVPAGVSFVPGSLAVVAGANTGPKTDAVDADQAELANGVVTFRLGAAADGTKGGQIAIGGSTTVKFRVTIDADAVGTISNQAVVHAKGLQGSPQTDTPTDGNGGMPGAPPTEVLIDGCESDAMCPAMTPLCDTADDPNLCVQCLDDGDCGVLVPVCAADTHACVCVVSGPELCDGADNDCDAALDEGFDLGVACELGIGLCKAGGVFVCDGNGGSVCNAVPGSPTAELCDSLDNDCDGGVDDGLGLGDACIGGVGECAADGALECDGNGGVACSATPLPAGGESCDGLDNDCDGAADEDYALGSACFSGIGECAVAGLAICNDEGDLGCDAIPAPPGVEVCGDDLDSDCDGNLNNGCACAADPACGAVDSGQVCTAGVCIAGCHGEGGNGCPAGFTCSSVDETIGQCEPDVVDTTTTTDDTTTTTDDTTTTTIDTTTTGGLDDTGTTSTTGASDPETGNPTIPEDPTTGALPTTSAGSDSDGASHSGEPDTGGLADTGATSETNASSTGDSSSSGSGSDTTSLDDGGGCGCDTHGGPAPVGLGLLVLAGLRRRRRDA